MKKSWIHKHEDEIIVITTIIFLLGLVITILAIDIHNGKQIFNNTGPIETTTTQIFTFETTIKETITEETTTTEEKKTKNTTMSSLSYSSSSSKESDSSFSSISTIAFYYDDEEPVYISAEEYYTICMVVMGEAGLTYEGSVAVAQSIRNQIIREKKLGHPYDIESVRSAYQLYYTKKPNDAVRQAVTDVFYNHIVVTKESIIAWIADGHYSSWHSQQIKVGSWGGNTFYKLRNQDF